MVDLHKLHLQKTIDSLVNEFRQKLENELTPDESTKFLCVDTDGEIVILDSKRIPAGTLIGSDCWEAFRVITLFGNGEKPWTSSTGFKMSHEMFAQAMRDRPTLPKIIYWPL